MADEKKPEGFKKKKLVKGRHHSAIKRHKQSVKKAARNRPVRSELRTAKKKVIQALQSKKLDDATTLLKEAARLFQKAVSKNVLHKKTASRYISRLSSLVSKK